MTAIALSLGGQQFTGWKSADVKTGIEQGAGTFQFECSDRWAINGQETPLLEGTSCSVMIAGQTVITGFIDESNVEYSSDSHSLSISGRDAAGDLVDCAAISAGFGVLNQTLLQIAKTLCAPFGVAVSVAAGVNIGPAFQFQRITVGETVWETLQKLAQIRGVLLVSDGMGGIQFTQAGITRANTRLVLGQNILACNATHSVAERFRTYQVYSQALDADFVEMQEVFGSATDLDPAIRPGRVTIVDPIEPSDIYNATTLAQWTANTRRAQGERAQYTVRGWMDGPTPWMRNTIVPIDDPWGRFQGDFLIANVNYKLDEDGGELALLDVVPRDAYTTLVHTESPDLTYQLFAIPPDAGE
jgi:prophage tail gpP-like protein